MNSFLIEPTASGMWHLTRHNDDGTYTYLDRYRSREEAESAATEWKA